MTLTAAERRAFWLAAYASAYADGTRNLAGHERWATLNVRRVRCVAVADEALASLSEVPDERVPGGTDDLL